MPSISCNDIDASIETEAKQGSCWKMPKSSFHLRATIQVTVLTQQRETLDTQFHKKCSNTWCNYSYASGSPEFLLREGEFLQEPWLLTTFLSGHDEPQIPHGCFITNVVLVCQLTSVAWHNVRQLPFASFISGLFPVFGLSMSAGRWTILIKSMELVTLQPALPVYNNLMLHLPSVTPIWHCLKRVDVGWYVGVLGLMVGTFKYRATLPSL